MFACFLFLPIFEFVPLLASDCASFRSTSEEAGGEKTRFDDMR